MKTFRTLILTVAIFCCGIMTANAQLGGGQKLAYVDSEYIMSNIPEYADAQEELESYSTKWQNEVKTIYDKVSEMYKKYQTEMVLLSEDQKHAREQEIINKEQEAKTLQMQYFGSEGQLFQKTYRTDTTHSGKDLHRHAEPCPVKGLCLCVRLGVGNVHPVCKRQERHQRRCA